MPSIFHFPTLPIPGVPTPSYTPPYPTLIEYSGYGYANPAGPGKRHRRARQPDGLRRGRREHARDRLLGRRLRLLRTAAEPRRLRRDRNDRPPAVGARQQGRACSASPTAGSASCSPRSCSPPDLEAIAPLSVIDATATTLYPGGILNTGFAVAWAEQRQQNAEPAGPGQRPGVGLRTDPGRRPDLRGQPGPARRGGEPAGKDQRKLDLQPVGGRPARPGHVRQQHQRADVHGLPVGGRADRRPLRRSGPALHRHDAASGSRSPTAPTSTRSIRTRTTGCTTSWSCTSPTRRRSSTRRSCMPRPRSSTTKRWGCPKTDVVTLPPDPIQEQPTYESALAAFEALPADPGAVRQRRGHLADRQQDGRRSLPRLRTVVLRSSRSPARRPSPGTSAPGGTLNEQPPTRRRRRHLHLGRERHCR